MAIVKFAPAFAGMLKHLFLCILFVFSASLSSVAVGEEATENKNSNLIPGNPVPVVVWNRELTRFRIGWEDYNTEERAAHAVHRITHIEEELLQAHISVKPAQIGELSGYMFYASGELLFGLALQDFSAEEATDIDATVAATVERIKEVFNARLEQRRPDIILYGLLWVGLATLLMAVLFFTLHVGNRRIQRGISNLPLHLPTIGGFDLTPICRWFLRTSIRIPFLCIIVFILIVWLTFSLSQFPYTKPLAGDIDKWLFAFGLRIGFSIVDALPGLFMIGVIVIFTRILVRALDAFFSGIEHGTILLEWMQPETAKASRRIVCILVWLFAMTVAYPYIPGSSSDAFKGVSVFAGLLLTLGSAGMVNQVMSGLVVVYARMMKPGDIIKVGDVTGEVIELGFLSTKVRTSVGHEVSMPNALLVGTSVSNYSRYKSEQGPIISTTVTIGYDTPWRQVHAMLEMAASRAEGVNHQEKPVIIQTALSDWYVAYEIRCVINSVEKRIFTLSHLHACIQDTFNEYGVQIMSPNFVNQPEKPVVVPKDNFYLSPAAPKPE